MNSSNFEQGDIVVAQVLFSEQIGLKTRPALVISNTKYNKKSEDIILLKITSQSKRTTYDINLNNKDLENGELTKPSMIMIDNPVTTYRGMISTKIGKITNTKLKEVKKKLSELYELQTKNN
ncbi:MAG: type II toxin-antitoxin system PemK/MazF family toxin [Candidatus Diapherotrites archaeon]|jgi:mRNA interferase MazF|uniref:Type II toxin-antitoxin system PemK/MazF family toxin n=1 Tax=Candidatus Iainarchaeum sp. TaxID=3101447 RepID=A0A8T5GEY2_9ARCH|nr:type II toxin-antitoxin system PemK/MazF family toxin [Candidatus Diapherotrites archaeon]MBT7241562.1 type II toxin-antitoxin system PemK/MazF family toxin [Candidatus Diapherotrites archaeon]